MNESHFKELIHSLVKPFYNWKSFLIMALSTLLLFPIIFIEGYLTFNVKKSLCKNKKLDKFSNWKNIGGIGILVIIISLVWYLPLGIYMLLKGNNFFNLYFYSWAGLISFFDKSILYYWVGILIISLIIWYLFPIAILRFINKGKFSEGFHIKKILELSLTKKYFSRWFLAEIITGILLTASLIAPNLIFASLGISYIPSYLALIIYFIKQIIYLYTFLFSLTFLGLIYED